MDTIKWEIKGDQLVIVIDCSPKALAAAPKSSTGKTNVVASTHGNKAIGLPGGKVLHLGVNAYTK